MVLAKYIIVAVLASLSLTSCSDGQSLQKYLVDKQGDDNFVKVDIAASLLQTKDNNLSQEQKDILKTVKKINVVAFPITEEDIAVYETEKSKLKNILNAEKYKTLIKMGSSTKGATLKYTGEEDAIDELIIFASDNEKGFAVFRLLGDNMRPDQMLKLMESVESGDLDVSKLDGIGELFDM